MNLKQILCASRNPTSPSRTSSCTKVAQDGAKLAPNWVQQSTKNGVPHRTWGPKMGYPIGPGTINSKKNRFEKATLLKDTPTIIHHNSSGWAGGVTRSVKNWNKVGRNID